MGYQVQVILTNAIEVSKVWGSKNMSLMQAISEFEYEDYDYFLEEYYDLSSNELSSKVLMENILNGTTENTYPHLMLDKNQEKLASSTLGGIYNYLEKDICLYFGKIINRNQDGFPMLTEYLDDFERKRNSYLKNRPYSLSFPEIFYIIPKQFDEYEKKYSEKFKEMHPNNMDLQKDVQYIFSKAREEKRTIFLINS